ncbi:MAG: hypothetical protein HGB05_10350 [Chloroflexi bacterium]|jgi:hypothetical protein|nr:hypothetical protein [Chloroflexota bacterium]
MALFQPVNEQLGYCFHPPTVEHSLGYPQLDVVIRPTPTGEHFDPELLTCLIATAGGPTKLHVTHAWTQETAYRVCAGEIDIEDVRHEHVKAFTFGGDLRIDSDAQRTVCQLTSPAPLLEHARQTLSLEEHLIEEVYILFAERRAVQDDDVFDRRLAAADPLLLYRACLAALSAKFAHFPVTDNVHRRFMQFLRAATQPLEDEAVPTLADLL